MNGIANVGGGVGVDVGMGGGDANVDLGGGGAVGGIHDGRIGGGTVGETEAENRATVSVGMAVTLGALTMTFAAVLLAYAIVRAQAPAWPPPGERGPPSAWPWPIAATVVVLAGSVAMFMAERQRRPQRTLAGTVGPSARLTRALIGAAAAGGTFIVIQTTAWIWLTRAGFRPDSGIVASVIYALTMFHALHALAALVALTPLLIRAARRRPIPRSALTAVSSFWHLVTIVWIVVFLAVFVA